MRRFFDKYIVLLSLIPVLAVMAVIFHLSSQTGDESGALSARVTAAVIRVVCPDFDGLGAEERSLLFDRAMHIVRKAAHFSAFAALGFFLLGHFRALALKTALRRPALGAVVTGVLNAASDEFHQSFVGGRSPGLPDVGIDGAGVLFGVLVMALLLRLCRSRKRRS